jgi:hypothetical protein
MSGCKQAVPAVTICCFRNILGRAEEEHRQARHGTVQLVISKAMDSKTTKPDQSGQPDNPAASVPPAVPGHGMASMSSDDLENDINDADVKKQPVKPAESKK